MVLSIPWNDTYIPHKPFPTQLQYLLLPHLDAFFGGAAGGGKSDVLLMGALQYVHVPGYSAILLRRTLTELKQPKALLNRAAEWLGNTPCKYNGDEHTYYFPTKWPNGKRGPDAMLQFGFLGDFQVEQRYQGAEYQYVGIDEASHFENDSAPTYLFSRLRKNVCPTHKLKKQLDPATGKMENVPNYVDGCTMCNLYKGLPIRFRIASNPGGPGHNWLKNRYKIEKKVYEENGVKKYRFVGMDKNKPFIPSKIEDNFFIDQRQYRTSLQELDDVRKKQLEDGDWDASPDSRFRMEDARYYKRRGDDYIELNGVSYSYRSLKIFGTTDIAATIKAGLIDQDVTKNGPSFTVISIWGLTPDFHLIWLYMRRFRDEIPVVVDNIYDTWKIFKPEYVKIETNGVGLGAFQLARLKGVPVKENFKAKDKFENATNALYRMSKNRIWLPEEASWLKEATDEIFSWTGHPGMTDDIVDTLSDACNDITWDANNADPIFQDQSGVGFSTGPAILGADGLPYYGGSTFSPPEGSGGFDSFYYF
jgi:hypothetical protein